MTTLKLEPSAKVEQSVRSAREAGLRYVTDFIPGIRRVRSGKGFRYLDPSGAALRDPRTVARCRSLAVPPGWTDVWICPFPNGHLQATARDVKGRKQYLYHARYREARDSSKFDRMLEFSEVLPLLRETVERDIHARGLCRRTMLATCVRLLEKTLIRVGTPKYVRENGSYGLTTLRRRHVQVGGDTVRFHFRGKSGVWRTVSVEDPVVARIVQRCQMAGGEKLLRYVDDAGASQEVFAGDINDYLKGVTGRVVTAKDFRTWAGTMYAAAALRDIGPAPSATRAKANVAKAVREVAERLGNTPSVCRKYYIHPAVLEAYQEGRVIPPAPPVSPRRAGPAPAALRRHEVAVLQLIHEQLDRGGPAGDADGASGNGHGRGLRARGQ